MGLFGGIKAAKYSEGGVYILPGVGRVEILGIKSFKTRKGQDAYAVECKMVESSNAKLPPGSVCTWMVTLDKEPALGNIKHFVNTLLPQIDFDKLSEEDCEKAVLLTCADGDPLKLKGKFLRFAATEIMTKANRPFTKVKWLADNTSAADVAKAAAEG